MNSNDFGAENTTAASSNPAKQVLAVLLHTGKDEQIPTTLSTSYAEPPDNAVLLSATNVGRVSMSMPKTSEKVGEIKREFKKKSSNNKLCSALTLGRGAHERQKQATLRAQPFFTLQFFLPCHRPQPCSTSPLEMQNDRGR